MYDLRSVNAMSRDWLKTKLDPNRKYRADVISFGYPSWNRKMENFLSEEEYAEFLFGLEEE